MSRAFRVRAVLPNPELELPAGMFMHVSVVLEERPAVLIPEQAVLAEGGSTYVFIVADGRAERREVRLGQREAGTVEVLDGLAAGELVVRARPAAPARRRRGAGAERIGPCRPTAGGPERMISDFCIKRPVFAAVLSLLIIVLGDRLAACACRSASCPTSTPRPSA